MGNGGIVDACDGYPLHHRTHTTETATAIDRGDTVVVSQPQPKADRPVPEPQRRYRRRGERYQPGQPLTREDLEELGTGGPWESDDEFDEWLETLVELRHAS